MTGAKSKKTKKGRPSLYTEALANRWYCATCPPIAQRIAELQIERDQVA